MHFLFSTYFFFYIVLHIFVNCIPYAKQTVRLLGLAKQLKLTSASIGQLIRH